ncbi:MAG: YdeI/OmpD-associated family protein [Burkholderiaceae bacterium]|nr:YdeI/OmpD-associated family protein [Microbacteriaceae bacterium]
MVTFTTSLLSGGGTTTGIEVPAELADAFSADDAEGAAGTASAAWAALSFSAQNAHAVSIEGAKTPETRAKRVAKVLEELRTPPVIR